MMPKTDAFLRPYTALPAKAAFFSCRTQSFTKKTPPPHIFRIPLYVAVIKHTSFPGLPHCLLQGPLLQILHLWQRH